MASLSLTLMGWFITLTLSSIAAAALWRPLLVLLGDLCGTEQRSRFWTIWSVAMMILVPLLAVSAVDLNGDAVRVLRGVVFYAVGGIVTALKIVAVAPTPSAVQAIAATAKAACVRRARSV